MDQIVERRTEAATASLRIGGSPVTSDRIRALAQRAVDGAPALTQGEVRELAKAVLEHDDRAAAD